MPVSQGFGMIAAKGRSAQWRDRMPCGPGLHPDEGQMRTRMLVSGRMGPISVRYEPECW